MHSRSRDRMLRQRGLVSVDVAATVLRVHVATVRRWIAAGRLAMVREGTHVYVHEADVRALDDETGAW